MAVTWSLLKMQVTGPSPELQSQNLHFKRRFLCMLQLENHHCRDIKLIHENNIKHPEGIFIQWLGLSTYTAVTQVQSLVGELRSHKLHGTANICILAEIIYNLTQNIT